MDLPAASLGLVEYLSRSCRCAARLQELFQVKNFFYLGNYQMAINEASQGGFGEDRKIELDCLVNRSYIGMGNFQVPPIAPRSWSAGLDACLCSWWLAKLATTPPWTYRP